MKYFLSFDNDVSGPYEVPFIAQLYQQGIIDQESLLMADDDTKEWKPLVEWLPSVAALQTTASLLKKLTPAAATPAIECEKYVTRMRGASSYKALRGCMNISLAVCVVILAMISIAGAHTIYIHNLHHRLVSFLVAPAFVAGTFILFAAYQASILFIDMADALIDLGRHQ